MASGERKNANKSSHDRKVNLEGEGRLGVFPLSVPALNPPIYRGTDGFMGPGYRSDGAGRDRHCPFAAMELPI